MIAAIMRLRPVDRLLIVLFVIYAVFIISAWLYVERERIRNGQVRTLNGLILHIERLTNWIRSDRDEYDSSWMDPEKWEDESMLYNAERSITCMDYNERKWGDE